MTIKLTAMELKCGKVTIYVDSVPQRRRVRCRLGVPWASDDPTEFIAQLRAQGMRTAQVESNACGSCTVSCLWNRCFSIPTASVSEVINQLSRAAQQLWKLHCQYVEITMIDRTTTYSFSWHPETNILYYFRFVGNDRFGKIGSEVGKRLCALPQCRQVEPIRQAGKAVGVKITLNRQASLHIALEHICKILATN